MALLTSAGSGLLRRTRACTGQTKLSWVPTLTEDTCQLKGPDGIWLQAIAPLRQGSEMTQASGPQQTPEVLLFYRLRAMSSDWKTSIQEAMKLGPNITSLTYRILYTVLCVKPPAPSPFCSSRRRVGAGNTQEMATALHPSAHGTLLWSKGKWRAIGFCQPSRTEVKFVGTLHWAQSTRARIREETKKSFLPSFRTFLDSNWLSHASCSASTLPAQLHTTAAYEPATDSCPYLIPTVALGEN